MNHLNTISLYYVYFKRSASELVELLLWLAKCDESHFDKVLFEKEFNK